MQPAACVVVIRPRHVDSERWRVPTRTPSPLNPGLGEVNLDGLDGTGHSACDVA